MVQFPGNHTQAAPQAVPSLHRESRPPGVLIVDDDHGVRDMLAIGFNVWPAPDCRTALEIYRENFEAIGVALLDVVMPGRDGPATLGELRAINPELRACFMTGNAGCYSEQNLFDLGANAVFWKPLYLLEVIEHLRELAIPSADSAERSRGLSGDSPTATEDNPHTAPPGRVLENPATLSAPFQSPPTPLAHHG